MADTQTGILSEQRAASGERGFAALANSGRFILAVALLGVAALNLLVAGRTSYLVAGHPPRFPVIPTLPWLSAQAWLGWSFGVLLAVCGAGLLTRRWRTLAGSGAAWLLLFGAIAFDLPRYLNYPASMGLRTLLFEPLAIGAMAWLVACAGARNIDLGMKALLAAALVVFGADHIVALLPGNPARAAFTVVMPHWLPWPIFWIALFGVAFVAAAASLASDRWRPWGMAGLGLMFAIWVLTLHLPRVLGWYGDRNGLRSPDEWSSLLIAVALWGGGWALAGGRARVRELTS